MAMILNPNKLQFSTDNFNSSTGGSDIGEDTNIHHNDSHFWGPSTLLKSFMGIISCDYSLKFRELFFSLSVLEK